MAQTLRIYRLEPTAPLSDPNWQNSPPQGDVVVRAASTGDARFVAAQAEGGSTSNGSAFLNEKLYTVVEDGSGRFDLEGERAVLAGEIVSPLPDPTAGGLPQRRP